MKYPLSHVIFEATRSCNLQCKYCYNIWHVDHDAAVSKLSYSETLRTLRRLFTVAEVDHITISGGEPFLVERILELALYCRMKRRTVTLISNGTLGKREDYRQLVLMGVSAFEFPYHAADPAIHDLMTSMKGSWERSVQSIRDVIACGGKVIPVIVLSKHNCAEIGKTLHSLKLMGVKHVKLARFNLGGRGLRYREELMSSKNELRAALRIANDYSAINTLSISANVCFPYCVIHPQRYQNILMGSCNSSISRRALSLDPEGNLRACAHSPMNLGNIFHDELSEMFASNYGQRWRLVIPSRCEGCHDWDSCSGGCRAASEQMGLGLEHADPVIDLMEKM